MSSEIIELIKTLAWPSAIMVVGVLVYLLIQRGTVSSVSAGKDGISLQLVESRQEREYFMNRRIAQIDQDLHTEIMSRTRALKKPLLRVVKDAGLCTAALRAIAADLRAPIYQAVDENDFKVNMATANREAYLGNKLGALKDEYTDLVSEAGTDPCVAGSAAVIVFPDWESVEPGMARVLDGWADRVSEAVVTSCRRKIEVYEEYRPQFQAARDRKFTQIVEDCIAKNQGYIEALGKGMTMEQGIQTFFAEVGEAACYALDIIQIGMEETGQSFDPVTALLIGIRRRDIYYNDEDPDDNLNFYVNDPAAFLSRLTGMRWTVEKADPGYIGQPGERIVERWELIQTGKVIGHFRLPHWDSIIDSRTVRYGNLVSKRVFRRVA